VSRFHGAVLLAGAICAPDYDRLGRAVEAPAAQAMLETVLAHPQLSKYVEDPQFTRSMGSMLSQELAAGLDDSARAMQLLERRDLAGAARLSGLTEAELTALLAQRQGFLKKGVDHYRPQTWTLPRPRDGVPFPYREQYEGIISFFNDPARVFGRLQELEMDVLRESRANPGKDRGELLEGLLAKREKAHGFAPAVELPEEVLSDAEWHRMLNQGALFNDNFFKRPISDLNRKEHGVLTHRLQWNVLMREMARHPESFGAASVDQLPSAPALFRMLGDEDNIKASGGQSTWGPLFDSKLRNFASPEYFHTQHEHLPGIGIWR
jgi:hypothetical protein